MSIFEPVDSEQGGPFLAMGTAVLDRGFTLIELMITIAVLAVLLTIGIPSFSEAMLGSRLSSYANEFVASANLARSEAIKRNSRVGLCVSSDGVSCLTSGGWDQGWVVFHDSDNNGVFGSGELVLQRQQALAGGFSMTAAGDLRYIQFEATGIGATAATLTICNKTAPSGSKQRVITLTAAGRLSVATTTGTCS